MHGDLEVPQRFVVPSEAPWAEEAWGLKLGSRVDTIRNSEHYVKHHPERRAELDALGFVWDDLERRWEEVHAALLAYQEVNGALEVPPRFVRASEAPWAEAAWGLTRGSRVGSSRDSGDYRRRHACRRAACGSPGIVWRS